MYSIIEMVKFMKNVFKLETTAFSLHVIAMVLMLCDHLWATVISGNEWLTCIGRISFPIFAFLIVEGYFHTKNLKKYAARLLVFAVISEIPFNLVTGSRLFYPIHQNVLWTFLIAIALIHLNEKVKKTKPVWIRILVGMISCMFGSLIGLLTMVDYYHAGVLTVLVFYFFRGRSWWHLIGQFVCLGFIQTELLGGLVYELSVLGATIIVHQQSFAMLSLIFIWLYQGKQGYYNKFIKWFNYWFYPVHLLILGVLKLL